MPRPKGSFWNGYKRLYPLDENKKRIPGGRAYAQCESCPRKFRNTEAKTLLGHRKQCIVPNNTTTPPHISPEHQSSSPVPSEDSSSNHSFSHNSQNSSFSSGEESRTQSTSALDVHLATDINRSSPDNSINTRVTVRNVKAKRVLKRKMPSSEANNSDLPETATVSKKEKEVAIYQFILCNNLPWHNVNLLTFADLFEKIDPSFKVPSMHDLRTTIARRACDEVHDELQGREHSRVMQLIVQIQQDIQVEQDGDQNSIKNQVFLMSLLGTNDDKWTYIDKGQFICDIFENISPKLEEFCDKSVVHIKNNYEVDVLFVIYNSECELKSTYTVQCEDDEITYFMIGEFDRVIKNLNCDLVCNGDNITIVSDYHNAISRLRKVIVQDKLFLSTAVQCLFEIIDNLDERNKLIVASELKEIISPLQVAAKIYHPTFHKNIVYDNVFKEVYTSFYDFQIEFAPRSVSEAATLYLDKTGSCIKILYSKGPISNPAGFWNIVGGDRKDDRAKHLAEYAKNLLKIPARSSQIDLKMLLENRSKYSDDSADFDRLYFTYHLEHNV